MEQHKNYLEKPKLAMELNLKGIEIVRLYIYIKDQASEYLEFKQLGKTKN